MNNRYSLLGPRLLRVLPWFALATWLVAFGVRLGPLINEDSLFGLLVARDGQNGAPWNHLLFPDHSNLNETASAFVAWWAPAQWMVPDAFHRAGLPLGWALTVTSLVALAGGLVGWVRLYRRLGYAEPVVLGTLLLIVLSVNFWRRLAEYHGGEVLLFGVLPWIILVARNTGLGIRTAGLLPVIFFAGAFIKLSFSISALALVAFLWAKDHLTRPFSAPSWRAGATAAASFVIFYGLFRVVYLSRGITPEACIGPTPWPDLLFMPAGPVSFLIAGQQLSGRVWGELTGLPQLIWGVTASVAALTLIVAAVRRAPSQDARMAAVMFCTVNVAAIAYLCWRGNRVWFIDRMFMPGGLLLLPAMVHLALHHRRSIAGGAAIALFAGATAYSLAHAVQYARWMRTQTGASPQHIRHLGLDQAGVTAWRRLGENPPSGALVFYADPAAASLALEWPQWRNYVPAYAAICGMIDGGPPSLPGRPPVVRVVSFAHSPPEYTASRALTRFADLRDAKWQQVPVGGVMVWTTGDRKETPP